MQGTNAPEVSAGVVVMRNDPKKGWCVLALRIGSRFDLPKGHIEESHLTSSNPILTCAADELDQEADIDLLPPGSPLDPSAKIAALISTDYYTCSNLNKSGEVKKNVHLFAAITECPDATIKMNPESQIYEHDEVVWIPAGKIESSRIHPYLKPGVMWALSFITEE